MGITKGSREQLHDPQTKSLSGRLYTYDRLSAKDSPRQSIAKSLDERDEHIPMGASGSPVADDPIPEIGHGKPDTKNKKHKKGTKNHTDDIGKEKKLDSPVSGMNYKVTLLDTKKGGVVDGMEDFLGFKLKKGGQELLQECSDMKPSTLILDPKK